MKRIRWQLTTAQSIVSSDHFQQKRHPYLAKCKFHQPIISLKSGVPFPETSPTNLGAQNLKIFGRDEIWPGSIGSNYPGAPVHPAWGDRSKVPTVKNVWINPACCKCSSMTPLLSRTNPGLSTFRDGITIRSSLIFHMAWWQPEIPWPQAPEMDATKTLVTTEINYRSLNWCRISSSNSRYLCRLWRFWSSWI